MGKSHRSNTRPENSLSPWATSSPTECTLPVSCKICVILVLTYGYSPNRFEHENNNVLILCIGLDTVRDHVWSLLPDRLQARVTASVESVSLHNTVTALLTTCPEA